MASKAFANSEFLTEFCILAHSSVIGHFWQSTFSPVLLLMCILFLFLGDGSEGNEGERGCGCVWFWKSGVERNFKSMSPIKWTVLEDNNEGIR